MARKGASLGIALALAAAALYALSTPFSKVLLASVPSTMMAALLYLGAGLGMGAVGLARAALRRRSDARSSAEGEEPLSRSDLPYVVGMVALDIAAPILLMAGLATTSAESTSLLNNFEIVATAVIAFALFREPVSRRLAGAIAVIVVACAMLSLDEAALDASGFALSPGALLVLAASVCWGFENNCTNRLSAKDPLQVVVVKGVGSGAGALAVSFAVGDAVPDGASVVLAMLLGFVAYGLSIFCYVYAQRFLGAARTSAYYAVSPFIGVGLAWTLFRDAPTPLFVVAFVLMAVGAWLAAPPAAERKAETRR